MTEPEQLRVFVNGKALSVAHGATVADAISVFGGDEASGVSAGTRAVTDSRGLPVALTTPVSGGAVFRTVSARAARDADAVE
jgi:hypothetical protein